MPRSLTDSDGWPTGTTMRPSLRLAGQAVPDPGSSKSPRICSTRFRPAPSGEDPRDFAWHYLSPACSPRDSSGFPTRDSEPHDDGSARDGETLSSHHKDSSIVLWDLPSERPRSTRGPAGCRWIRRFTPTAGIVAGRSQLGGWQAARSWCLYDAATGRSSAGRSKPRRESPAASTSTRSHSSWTSERLVAPSGKVAPDGLGLRDLGSRLRRREGRSPCVALDGLRCATFAPEVTALSRLAGERDVRSRCCRPAASSIERVASESMATELWRLSR